MHHVLALKKYPECVLAVYVGRVSQYPIQLLRADHGPLSLH